MLLAPLLRDSPEYQKRLRTPFRPSKITLAEIHAAIPKHLHEKSTLKGLLYAVRCALVAFALLQLGSRVESFSTLLGQALGVQPIATLAKWALWVSYWYFQSLALASLWCLAHEAGHGNISPYAWVNDAVGFIMHTAVLVPYYAWQSTHRAHHKATVSIERDQNHMPRTRSEHHLPPSNIAKLADYKEMFEETPIFTLVRMLVHQLLGWNIYLLTDASGNNKHPKGTNHLLPSSSLFKAEERNAIIISDVGLALMSCILYLWSSKIGFNSFLKLYLIPYIFCNHWVVMLTFLHHSDPSVPYYRQKEWTFLRGALSTVDRPLLGWAGRFFFHNVSHDHIAHHLFSTIPFYNQPQVTEHIKKVLKEDYNYDSTNSFRALYRSFTECCFVEDEGEIVFYKNKYGQPARVLASNWANEEEEQT